MFFMYAALMIFLVSVDLLFFIVIATGIGIPVIIISQLITGCLGWMKIRKLDFNLFFYVEAEFQKYGMNCCCYWERACLYILG